MLPSCRRMSIPRRFGLLESRSGSSGAYKATIFEYVEVFYNGVRLHSYLGYVPPAEFEELDSERVASLTCRR